MLVAARAYLIVLVGCSAPPMHAPADAREQPDAGDAVGPFDAGSGGSPIDAMLCPPSSVLQEPELCRPWAGVVIAVARAPVTSFAIDGVTGAVPIFGRILAVDTQLLDDGPHELTLSPAGSAQFLVSNGTVSEPGFSGRLVDVTDATGIAADEPFSSTIYPAGAIAVDFDSDGLLDVVSWRSDTLTAWRQTAPLTFVPYGPALSMRVHAVGAGDLDGDGRPEVVAVGDRAHLLAVVPGRVGLVDVGVIPTETGHDYRSVTLTDLDADGLLDIAVGDFAPGGRSLVLRNEAALRFADVTDELGLALPDGRTYGITVDEPAGDGALEVWAYEDGGREPFTTRFRFVPGPDLPIVESTTTYGLFAPMGSVWFDVDGDERLELWLAGDFFSPIYTPPAYERSVAPFLGADAILGAATGTPVSAWSMALVDFDLDGRPDVFRVNDPSVEDSEHTDGRHTLWWRAPDGKLQDVSALAGLGGVQPCRAVYPADLDGDGDADLLVGCAAGLRVLRNDLTGPAPARRIALHGTSSNADGVNARVRGPGGELRLVRGGGQPFAGGVVQEILAAPTGVITVSWPSGVVQTVAVGAGPVVDVVEPEVVRVTPRRVSAGSAVSVVVDPEAFGAPPGSDVAVSVSAGAWSQPLMPWPDGRWRGALVAPAAPATVVLSVQIDGVAVGVRPRIFVR